MSFATLFASSLLTLSLFVLQVASLWPIPRNLQLGTSSLKLSPRFSVDIDIRNPPADLINAVSRSKLNLVNDKMQRLVVGRGSADRSTLGGAKQLTSLKLSLAPGSAIRSIMDESIAPLGTRREEYVLQVPSDGSPATLSANSTLGLLRGLTTFEQLWYDSGDGTVYTTEAPIAISDAPAFVRQFLISRISVSELSPLSRTVDSCLILHVTCTFVTIIHSAHRQARSASP